jgi:DNA modification methylase
VDLIVDILDTYHKNSTVLDLFGGSGSTLIACEKTARDCRMMELDPKYCDVIVKRWQDFTGQEATLDGTDETFAALTSKRIAA